MKAFGTSVMTALAVITSLGFIGMPNAAALEAHRAVAQTTPDTDTDGIQAGETTLRFSSLTPDQGLPGSYANDIDQDQLGLMWFSTPGGLAQYDGANFTPIPVDPDDPTTMPQLGVSSIVADPVSGMWAAPGELVYVDSLSQEVTRTGLDARALGAGETVIWALASEGQMHLLDAETRELIRTIDVEVNIPSSSIGNHLAVQGDDCAAFADGEFVTVVCADGSTRSIPSPAVDLPSPAGDDETGRIHGINPASNGDLWVTTNRYLWSLDLTSDTWVKVFDRRSLRPNDLAALGSDAPPVERADGQIWTTTFANGLDLINPNSGRGVAYLASAEPGGIYPSGNFRVFVDHDGGTWIGKFSLGVQYLPPGPTEVWATEPDTAPGLDAFLTSMQDMVPHDDELLIACDGCGLRSFNPQNLTWGQAWTTSNSNLANNAVLGLSWADDNEEELWLSTFDGGLQTFDPNRKQKFQWVSAYEPGKPLHGSAAYQVERYQDTMWTTAYDSGVVALDRITGEVTQVLGVENAPLDLPVDITITNSIVLDIVPGPGGVWIAGNLGVEYVDLATGEVSFWSSRGEPDSLGLLEGNTVYDIHVDNQGILWAGTSTGIEKIDPSTNEVTSYYPGSITEEFTGGETRGITANVIQVFPSDDGEFWLATTRGLSKFNPETNEVTREYNTSEGLLTAEFSRYGHLQLSDDTWVISSTRGVVFLDEQEPEEFAPQALVTGLFEDGDRRPWAQNFSVAHDVKSLGFQLSGIDYESRDTLLFQTRLRGFDNEWRTTSGTEPTQYYGLSPGEYAFEVRAVTNEGVLGEPVVTNAVQVVPAWWQLSWLRILAIAALLALIVLVFVRRTRQSRVRENELEEIVSSRTLVLREQQDELDVRRREAEDANRAKTTFLSHVSHELRSPLASVLGLAELLKLPDASEEDRTRWVDAIQSSGLHLQVLLEEILDVAAQQGATQPLDVSSSHLPTLLESVAETSTAGDATRTKTITASVDVVNETVLCDERRLRQILINLCTNAVRYSEGPEITITVAEAPSSTQGMCRYRFGVKDPGPGIAPATVRQMFEPFFRGDGAAGPGLGLGLAISMQLAERLGGTLEVDTAPGSSTEFFFTLELRLAQEGDAAQSPSEAPGITVLVVDDDLTTLRISADTAKMAGIAVTTASTQDEAIEAVRTQVFDLVLMDHRMPEVAGHELVNRLRQESGNPDLLAVAVTATPELAAREGEGIYSDVIAKPVRVSDVVGAAQRLGQPSPT